MTDQEQKVHAALALLGIAFERYEHPPVASAIGAEQHWSGIDAAHTKNLFLRNQTRTQHYLLSMALLKRANLRAVADQIGHGRLSFGTPERMMTYLGVTPGSVSPFGLIHDTTRAVRVYLDRDLKNSDRISFHPNINTATLVLSFADFERFLASRGNSMGYVTV
ncbi:MAG TPA: prolyl-tRNA synthetase associated domain-containing protein [Vicinamibacterales bacterium]|nr:prolyl-tRNA synthetase associated domain-containing protein [Vicinamibacterales bacterium]